MAKNDPQVKVGPDGLINFKSAVHIVGITEQYFRRLVTTGKVPGATKNEKGWWRFDEKALRDWANDRPARVTDGKTTYRCRLSDEEAKALKETMPHINLVPAYKSRAKKE